MKLKPIKFFQSLLTVLVISAFVFSAFSDAEGKGDEVEVESILDRLEKRLLDQESETLSFGEKSSIPDIKKKASREMRFEKKENIVGTTAEMERLNKLAALISALEANVDKLTAKVQKTKQKILNDSSVDNFVSIDAKLLTPNKASIKSLSVKLDGYHIYELQEASGLWLPSKVVPLYAGPMQPGTHRIDMEARISMKHKKGIPLNSDVMKIVQKSFEIAIPGGTSGNKYMISLNPPKSGKGNATAEMKEVL
jgi:hypothetical protein